MGDALGALETGAPGGADPVDPCAALALARAIEGLLAARLLDAARPLVRQLVSVLEIDEPTASGKR